SRSPRLSDEGLRKITECSGITLLNLSQNHRITHLDSLAKLSSLQHLHIQGCQLNFKEYSNLITISKSLRSLSITRPEQDLQLDQNIPQALFPNLHSLHFYNFRIQNQERPASVPERLIQSSPYLETISVSPLQESYEESKHYFCTLPTIWN